MFGNLYAILKLSLHLVFFCYLAGERYTEIF